MAAGKVDWIGTNKQFPTTDNVTYRESPELKAAAGREGAAGTASIKRHRHVSRIVRGQLPVKFCFRAKSVSQIWLPQINKSANKAPFNFKAWGKAGFPVSPEVEQQEEE